MNCLKDYIGILGYDLIVPESGQFINQLQGISLKSLQVVANSEQVTFVQVWDDAQERAWRRLSSDFLIAMRAKYCLKKDTDTDVIICGDKALFTHAWMYLLATELMQERLYSERINKVTTIDRQQSIELGNFFNQMYEEALQALLPAVEWKEEELSLSRTFNRVERIP